MSVRIRESSQGLAQRIAADNNLSGLADAIQASLFGWDKLSLADQADILGREIEEVEEADERAEWEITMAAYRQEFGSDD